MDRLVEEALTHNRDIAAASAHLAEARAVLDEASNKQLPQTVVTADTGTGSTLQDQLEAAYEHRDSIRTGPRMGAGTDVIWELDLAGRIRSSNKAARADEDAAAALADSVRISVAAEVTRSWLQACTYSHRAEVARHSLQLVERGRDLAQALWRAGEGLPVDVARANVLVAQARAAIPLLEARRHDALTGLAVLTGRGPADLPETAVGCKKAPLIGSPVPIGEGRELLRRRPDVRAAERQLAGETARIGVAIADLYPRISLSGEFASSAHTMTGLGERDNRVWRVGPLLSWSFPNLGAARARIAQARARQAAALATFDATVLRAMKEVNDAAENYAAALRTQEALRTASEHSAHAAQLSRLGRAAGAVSALELLDAERVDTSTQAALAAADGDVAELQVVLFKALGGGWEDSP